jgi:hypothetical protein
MERSSPPLIADLLQCRNDRGWLKGIPRRSGQRGRTNQISSPSPEDDRMPADSDLTTRIELPRAELPQAEPSVLVIVGASGDLTRRKLIPALCHLAGEGLFNDANAIVLFTFLVALATGDRAAPAPPRTVRRRRWSESVGNDRRLGTRASCALYSCRCH